MTGQPIHDPNCLPLSWKCTMRLDTAGGKRSALGVLESLLDIGDSQARGSRRRSLRRAATGDVALTDEEYRGLDVGVMARLLALNGRFCRPRGQKRCAFRRANVKSSNHDATGWAVVPDGRSLEWHFLEHSRISRRHSLRWLQSPYPSRPARTKASHGTQVQRRA